ncbi:unnamed protein product, partial [Rotaria sp. Silwood2]
TVYLNYLDDNCGMLLNPQMFHTSMPIIFGPDECHTVLETIFNSCIKCAFEQKSFIKRIFDVFPIPKDEIKDSHIQIKLETDIIVYISHLETQDEFWDVIHTFQNVILSSNDLFISTPPSTFLNNQSNGSSSCFLDPSVLPDKKKSSSSYQSTSYNKIKRKNPDLTLYSDDKTFIKSARTNSNERSVYDTKPSPNNYPISTYHSESFTPNFISSRYVFEDFPNEIIFEIFQYLNIYYIYKAFYNINKKFQHLLFNSNIPLKVDATITISKFNFQHFYNDMIIPNTNRITVLRISDPFIADMFITPSHLISSFICLKRLVLDNISIKSFDEIIKNSNVVFPELNTLIIYPNDNQILLYFLYRTVHLLKLKYFKVEYEIKILQTPIYYHLDKNLISTIEHLVINIYFPYDTFYDVVCRMHKLRSLSIDLLTDSDYPNVPSFNLNPSSFENLKRVCLKLQKIRFNKFEDIVRKCFKFVEVLFISIEDDEEYLYAERWEKLISSHMQNLRIFDIYHNGVQLQNQLDYDELIHAFTSSFWIEKHWFFTHQYDCFQSFNIKDSHSTHPYRRKNCEFHWQLNKEIRPFQGTNFNSVEHVLIYGTLPKTNCANYFPNVNQLTINHYPEILHEPLVNIINRIIPLDQLSKLVIKDFDVPFERLINILYVTCNLVTFKSDPLSLNDVDLNSIQQTKSFCSSSDRNKIRTVDMSYKYRLIKTLDMPYKYSLKKIKLFIKLFRRLEHLTVEVNTTELERTVEYLIVNKYHNVHGLLFLCIAGIPAYDLYKLTVFIHSKKLIHDDCVKPVNCDLCLWW